MKIDVKELDKGNVELTIEVDADTVKPYLDRAATRLASKHQIPGFRPGKAPADVITKKFGESAVLDETIQELIPRTFYQAVTEKKLNTVGQPAIHIEKLAPGNPVVYKATVALVPAVTLNGWRDVKVEKPEIKVEDKDIDTMVDELRELQATEARVERAAKKGDKAEVNFSVSQDGAVIEGGTGSKFPIIIGSNRMIPGFEEQVEGLKAGDKKEFKLKFPKPYMNESLAGKEADFSVEVLGVYERTLPEANDEWANKMVGKPFSELRETLRKNLTDEQEQKSRHTIEHNMMEQLIKKATFGELPDLLIDGEVKKMLAELEHDVLSRGMDMQKYLESIKKTKDELTKDFRPQAIERVKGALILRTLGKELEITVPKEEIDAEIEKQRAQYKGNTEAEQQLDSPEYREYLERVINNRKTINSLIELLTK